MKNIKNSLAANLKNLIGWRTNRKIVVISVDDYGNVRVDSKEARERMDREGLKISNRFDAFDALETRQDLEILFDVLVSVRDRNGRHAVFTPFFLPCNINFEKVLESKRYEYHYELLPKTFRKQSARQPYAYEGAWELLKEGLKKKLIIPQFHGREHLNLKVFKEKLLDKDHELLVCLNNRSFTSISGSGYKTISPTASFAFWEFEENKYFHDLIKDGLNHFVNVFGYQAQNFTPPVYKAHPVLYGTLKKYGIFYIDTAMIERKHQGRGEYKTRFNYTGKRNKHGQIYLVRNVVFEPTQERGIDWVSFTMKQIEAAFRWNRPAIISSHRVNFCGHIDEENRKKGISALRELLRQIVQRWPEVEFMAANELGDLMASEKDKD